MKSWENLRSDQRNIKNIKFFSFYERNNKEENIRIYIIIIWWAKKPKRIKFQKNKSLRPSDPP